VKFLLNLDLVPLAHIALLSKRTTTGSVCLIRPAFEPEHRMHHLYGRRSFMDAPASRSKPKGDASA
jgi:hypothetical protein